MVLRSRYGAEGIQRLDRLPESARNGGVMAVDAAQAGIARTAWSAHRRLRAPLGAQATLLVQRHS